MIDVRVGDCRTELKTLAAESINCCVTSPPYWGLRDYGQPDQIGLEQTPGEYVEEIVEVFRGVRRVLRDDGTAWLNLGDSYASYRDARVVPQSVGGGQRTMPMARAANRSSSAYAGTSIKHKDVVGIPWRVAFGLRDDGWYLRQEIIWHKPNPMPERVTDRCTKSHEYIFLLSKSANYFYDADAIREGREDDESTKTGTGRNKRSVWTVATQPYPGSHFATFPSELIEPCILAGCPKDGIVLDPFGGAGTTGLVADRLGRNSVLIELNPTYAEMARSRLYDDSPLFVQFGK